MAMSVFLPNSNVILSLLCSPSFQPLTEFVLLSPQNSLLKMEQPHLLAPAQQKHSPASYRLGSVDESLTWWDMAVVEDKLTSAKMCLTVRL